MGYTVTYNRIWKWITDDNGSYNIYGVDFNPDIWDDWMLEWSLSVKNSTTSFDLSNFQHWTEVWCSVVRIEFDSAYSGRLWGDFERYDWSWRYSWYFSWNRSGITWTDIYMYFWVDDDEVRPWYTKYRIHYYSTDWVIDFYSPEFTISGLSFDSSLHDSWYMRVEWSHLCYTDATHWSRGYKHIIAYDSSYSTSVWSDNKWYIRLDSSDNLRIYYVDRNWYRRRTYSSDTWYGWNRNVWSSNKWYMWVSNWSSQEDWYGYLCFIAPNWSKRRILNWPPAWYT